MAVLVCSDDLEFVCARHARQKKHLDLVSIFVQRVLVALDALYTCGPFATASDGDNKNLIFAVCRHSGAQTCCTMKSSTVQYNGNW